MLAWEQAKNKVFLHGEGGHSLMMSFLVRGLEEIHLFSKNTQTLSPWVAQKDTGDHGWEESMKRSSENAGEPCSWAPLAWAAGEPVCYSRPRAQDGRLLQGWTWSPNSTT